MLRAHTIALLTATLTACAAGTPGPGDAESPARRLPALGLNDVSVLVPLPRAPDEPALLEPTDAGAKGALLPQALFAQVPGFPVETPDTLAYDRLRVVAVRFDGCFPRPEGCEPQVRLVLQPVDADGAARDSALHLFYRLSIEELAALPHELRILRTLAPEVVDAPLTIHAGLAAQGPAGLYGTALRALVLRLAGESNLVRITFFLRAPPRQEEWFFGGFDRVGGALRPLDIKGGVGRGNQRVNRPLVEDGHRYLFFPEGRTPEDGSLFLDAAAARAASPAARKAAYASFQRVMNPARHGPDALPCAGCHVASFAAAFAEREFGLAPADVPDDAFASAQDVSPLGADGTPSSLRAFGWFGRDPMVSRRVANESAAVADDLEARFPEPL